MCAHIHGFIYIYIYPSCTHTYTYTESHTCAQTQPRPPISRVNRTRTLCDQSPPGGGPASPGVCCFFILLWRGRGIIPRNTPSKYNKGVGKGGPGEGGLDDGVYVVCMWWCGYVLDVSQCTQPRRIHTPLYISIYPTSNGLLMCVCLCCVFGL